MKAITPEILKLSFQQTLGNQGAPVVNEIVENFSNEVLSIVVENWGTIDLCIDFESLARTSCQENLVNFLTDKNITYSVRNYMFHRDIVWKIKDIKYAISYTSYTNMFFARGFTYKDPVRKLDVRYYSCGSFEGNEVTINDQEIRTNLANEYKRVFNFYL